MTEHRPRDDAEPLPVIAVGDLPPEPNRTRWLIDQLWAAQAVGVVGGTPKSCKTWLALELAVAVASGIDAFDRFPVPDPGPVLIYAAEDAPARVRERLLAISTARNISLAKLDVHLITTPALRLDSPSDRARLAATIEQLNPRLLLLDPLVRLHRCDENSSAEMASLLGELRTLQRRFQLAICVVHHLRKNASHAQQGQALRGSGDLHAWGDSNLYLRRRNHHLRLFIEHRAAAAPDPIDLELADRPAPHLRLLHPDTTPDLKAADNLAQRILALLANASAPTSRDSLRSSLQVRNSTLGQALIRLRSDQLIERCPGGFRPYAQRHLFVPVPTPIHAPGTERLHGGEAGLISP